jgi:serine/threonine-protein kinase
MATAHLGPPAALVKDLAECKLLTAEDLRAIQTYQQSSPGHSCSDLADFLVRRGILTPFQAKAALRGEAAALVLSRFVLTDRLGAGSLGTVYKARDGRGTWYALRVLPRRNVVSLKAFTRQVQELHGVRHPRVSALLHLGAAGERVYLGWPLLQGGENLEAIVRRDGPLSARQATQVGLQIASGLLPYHEHGLFHGLLKPTDVVIGADRRVRILDFGVGFLLSCERGKSLLDTMTNTKALARGLNCSSPESIMNALDRSPAGDQYSLGCVLYFCLTGRYPFPDDNPVKKMLAHQCEEPPPLRERNPAVPPRLAAIVQRLLRKTPAERYGSTAEVVEAFQALNQPRARAAGAPAPPPGPAAAPAPETAAGPAPGPRRHVSLASVAVVVGGLVLGSALGWFLAHR